MERAHNSMHVNEPLFGERPHTHVCTGTHEGNVCNLNMGSGLSETLGVY